MRRLEDFVREWSILIFLGGLALVGLAPTLGRQTIRFFSAAPPARQSVTLRPLQIVDENGTEIGWWQIKLDPTSVMLGDTADLEVTYLANRDLFHPPTQQDLPPELRYQSCIERNEALQHWGQSPADCGPPPPRENAKLAPLSVPQHASPPPINLLNAAIKQSDLLYIPREDTYSFKLEDIFQSPMLSDNHIWHLTTEQGKTEPGRKSVIIAFRVEPANYKQREVEINGRSVAVNGSEVPIRFDVRTATGLPRQFGAICVATYTAVGAICSSAAFLTVLRFWLGRRRRPTPRKGARRRS
jgi:hypothetical protein